MKDLSTDELLALAEDLDTRNGDIPARLEAVRGQARGEHGIHVTVTMAGMLVGLDLGESCRAMTAAALTAELRSLVWQATETALAAGIEIVSPAAGPELTAELTRLTAPPAREVSTVADPRPTTVDTPTDEDFSTQTFALRD